MCAAGAREGGNPWIRGPATTFALFLRLCRPYGKERRTGYHEYETHFSAQLAKISNDEVGLRATDVALGLRRLPSGFHTVVHHGGLEWRTENKPPSVNDDVEWSGPIPM
jgi:hypothetical protein